MKGFKKQFLGKEAFQRMNFLYQASYMTLESSRTSNDLSAYYGQMMTCVAQKSVLKMEPQLKRTVCKGCCGVLVPGVSAMVRVRPTRVIWTCLRCSTIKRFPTKPGYRLWTESEEACVGEITTSAKSGDSANRTVVDTKHQSKTDTKPKYQSDSKDNGVGTSDLSTVDNSSKRGAMLACKGNAVFGLEESSLKTAQDNSEVNDRVTPSNTENSSESNSVT